jgi:hypothetical protein
VSAATFTVTWSGGDDPGGAGVAGYDVYVYEDGGSFTPWLKGTAETSAAFAGTPGRTYAFASAAADHVGHRQAVPSAGQAVTRTEQADTTPPTSSVATLPALITTTTFTVSWAGSDNIGGSGIAAFDVYVSEDGGPYRPLVEGTAATSATFTGRLGRGYAFYSIAVDAAGNRQAAPAAAQAATFVGVPPSPPPANLHAVAHFFTHSPEYYRHVTTRVYHEFLGRDPDAGGLGFWAGRLENGLTVEQLEAGFIGSPEYIANHGGTGAGWVRGMYQDLLGRQPDAGGLAHWMGRLAAGANPAEVALGFAASAEREALHVQENYRTYLGRTASREEVDFWVGLFVSGRATNEDVAAGFVGSPEYYHNAHKGKGNEAGWLASAYADVLRRSPGEDELRGWIEHLR